MPIRKPVLRSHWTGKPGSKYRIYTVSDVSGNVMVLQSKTSAKKQYDMALSRYKRLKSIRKRT